MSIADEGRKNIAQIEQALALAKERGDEAQVKFFEQALAESKALLDNPIMSMLDALTGLMKGKDHE